MWIKRRSYFVLLRVRHKSVRFILPVPLFIFEDLLWAITDLVAFGTFFFPRQKLPGEIMRAIMNSLQSLRQMGAWKFVEISAGGSWISIDFN